MKKTFKTFALMLLTAFAFSSCVDVPAPYSLPSTSSSSGSSTETTVEASGDGTAASPFNVAGVVAKIKEMAAGEESTVEYYIKGKVLAVTTTAETISQYGNQTFTMIDEGGDNSTVFTAFQVLGPGKKKFTSVDDIKAGDIVIVCGKVVNYKGNTPETVGKGAAYVVSINPTDDGGGTTTEPTGDGTKSSPYNVAKIKQLISESKAPEGEIYIKGTISQIKSLDVSKYTRAQYYISDNGTTDNQFYVYNGLYLDGANFTSNDQIKVGDKVVILGTLGTYQSEYQVAQNSKIISINDNSGDGGGDTPPAEGTAVTCAQAVQLTSALADGGTSTDVYAVTGYITEVIGSVSKNQQSFWMADTKDGGKVFEAYWANLPEGVSAFVVGSKVTITGKLMKYVKNGEMTPEIKNATVVILEEGDGGGQGGDEGGEGGETVTDLENGDFESWVSDDEATGWKSACAASNATVSKSTDARNGSYACKVAAPGTANKRLATQEITLAAGSYTFSYYAKSTTADICQTRGGYVPVTNGTVGAYKYNSSYTDLNSTDWTLVTYDFELTAETTVCLIIMNPKGSSYSVSQDILVDDATLTKN